MIVALIFTIISMIDYLYNAKEVFMSNSEMSNNYQLAEKVIKAAKEKNLSLGCAESLTGGLVAASLTSVSGSSSVFAGGIVSYMYSIKTKLLGVPAGHLEANGAVNELCAQKMAKGALKQLSCDLTISTTGIAGPDKDKFDTEVGTVYIAIANKDNVESQNFKFSGSREEIRNKTVCEALKMFLNYI